jgi:hypothetical protein
MGRNLQPRASHHPTVLSALAVCRRKPRGLPTTQTDADGACQNLAPSAWCRLSSRSLAVPTRLLKLRVLEGCEALKKAFDVPEGCVLELPL